MLRIAFMLFCAVVIAAADGGNISAVPTTTVTSNIQTYSSPLSGGIAASETPRSTFTKVISDTIRLPPKGQSEPIIDESPASASSITANVVADVTSSSTFATNGMTTTTTTVTPLTTTTTTSSPPSTTTVVKTTVILDSYVSKWMVNGTNGTCIILQMALKFNLSYPTTEQKKTFKIFNIPVNALATGNCGILEQIITLSWSTNNLKQDNLTMHFVKNETTKRYSLHHLEIVLLPSDFPNYKSKESVLLSHNEPQFAIELSNSYRCLKSQTLNLITNAGSNITGYAIVSDLQFQAFKTDNSTAFGFAKDCTFDTPDIVPIAVGCALAGLVVIVLIAYLVGRRRSQARGYLSM